MQGLIIVLLLVQFSAAGKREGVVKFGTTMSPGLKRQEGKAAPRCPIEFPHVFNGGLHCCKFGIMAPICNGGDIRRTSGLDCCPYDVYVGCPEKSGGCYSHREAAKCKPVKALIYSSDPYGFNHNLFSPEYVFSYKDCEVWGDKSYYVTGDLKKSQKLIIDFGCDAVYSEVIFRNTQNGHFKDRGTKDFKMESSYDMADWTMLASGTMPQESNADACAIPTRNFTVQGHGRYFMFTAVTHHGLGAGINYIDWNFLE